MALGAGAALMAAFIASRGFVRRHWLPLYGAASVIAVLLWAPFLL